MVTPSLSWNAAWEAVASHETPYRVAAWAANASSLSS